MPARFYLRGDAEKLEGFVPHEWQIARSSQRQTQRRGGANVSMAVGSLSELFMGFNAGISRRRQLD